MRSHAAEQRGNETNTAPTAAGWVDTRQPSRSGKSAALPDIIGGLAESSHREVSREAGNGGRMLP